MKTDQYQMDYISEAGSGLFSLRGPNIDVLETRFIARCAAAGIKGGTCRLFKNGVSLCDGPLTKDTGVNAPGER